MVLGDLLRKSFTCKVLEANRSASCRVRRRAGRCVAVLPSGVLPRSWCSEVEIACAGGVNPERIFCSREGALRPEASLSPRGASASQFSGRFQMGRHRVKRRFKGGCATFTGETKVCGTGWDCFGPLNCRWRGPCSGTRLQEAGMSYLCGRFFCCLGSSQN